jgi:hypothetical protein
LKDPIGNYEIFVMCFSGVSLALFLYEIFAGMFPGNSGYYEGIGISVVFISLISIFVFLYSTSMMTVAANFGLFSLSIILLFYGKGIESPAVFNTGLLTFGIATITRYFDVGWMLMSRSMFFLVGGVILLAMGFIFEWNRRSGSTKAP